MGEPKPSEFNTILNAIPDVMALMDQDFRLSSVNAAWAKLARKLELPEDQWKPIGADYFESCKAIGIGTDKLKKDAENGIREVMEGKREDFEMEYPCHDKNEPRWFSLRVAAVPGEQGNFALATHVDITRRKLAEMELARETKKLREQSLTDPLTGLRNRRGLEIIGKEQWKAAQRRGGALAVVFVDLDKFKPINDRFGHDEGDRVLCFVADYLVRTFRDSDIVARVGGDELVVLAWMQGADDANKLVARLKTEHEMTTARGETYAVSFSIGIAVHDPKEEGDLVGLIKRADTAMYKHKNERNTERRD